VFVAFKWSDVRATGSMFYPHRVRTAVRKPPGGSSMKRLAVFAGAFTLLT